MCIFISILLFLRIWEHLKTWLESENCLLASRCVFDVKLTLYELMVISLGFFSSVKEKKSLTAHNWQIWKSRFLTCPCHKIYWEQAVGLKTSNYTLKIQFLRICEIWGNSSTQRSVSQENALKTSKKPSPFFFFFRITVDSNISFSLIENNFRFLR